MQDDKTTRFTQLLRWLGVLAACAALALVLVTRSRMLAEAQPPAAQSRIPVYYWHMWSGEWQPTMNHVVAEFNASQTKYEVIPLQVPYASANSKFLMSVAGGSPPDVMAQWTQAISTWSQDGILSPLNTRMTPAEKMFFLHGTYPFVHRNGWYKGHLYGLVINADVYACYYRPEQFRQAGLDPDKYAGHSLRAGLATSAAQAGVSERSIMAQTGHKSVIVARRYIRDGSLFRDNTAAQVGL